MANSQDVDLMAVGKHCGSKECRRLDFLPFTCDHCKDDFCHLHFDPKEHSCKFFISKDRVVPNCPICGKLVALSTNETINDQVERHINSGCKLLVAEKRRRNNCSQVHCKQKSLLPFTCNSCYKNFCVRHRHTWDHSCIPVPTTVAVAVH